MFYTYCISVSKQLIDAVASHNYLQQQESNTFRAQLDITTVQNQQTPDTNACQYF